MKKIAIMAAVLFLTAFEMSAQGVNGIVFDPVLAGVIEANNLADQAQYKKIRNEQEKTNDNLVITETAQLEIQHIKKTTLDYLKQVHTVLSQLSVLTTTIPRQTIKIRKNLNEVCEIAADNPMLEIAALQLQEEFLIEMLSVYSYIRDIVRTGGLENLMSNGERMRIIAHVTMKMDKMVALSSRMRYRMRRAKNIGLLETLCPAQFYYARQNVAIANRIIGEFHF